MHLLIDAGNSRLKYACHDGNTWLIRATLDAPQNLQNRLPRTFRPHRIIVANVAGQATAQAIQAALEDFDIPIEWLQATTNRCGLRCGYAHPAQLGPDRWAAAIGAWRQVGADCLVVSAGTATTIDILRAPGLFAGGCILPGLDLMLDSLAARTAALPRAPAEVPTEVLGTPPTDTLSALSAGCLHAQLGAIERLAGQLPADAPILVAGGRAETLAQHLGERATVAPWLVMDGLLAIATEQPLVK